MKWRRRLVGSGAMVILQVLLTAAPVAAQSDGQRLSEAARGLQLRNPEERPQRVAITDQDVARLRSVDVEEYYNLVRWSVFTLRDAVKGADDRDSAAPAQVARAAAALERVLELDPPRELIELVQPLRMARRGVERAEELLQTNERHRRRLAAEGLQKASEEVADLEHQAPQWLRRQAGKVELDEAGRLVEDDQRSEDPRVLVEALPTEAAHEEWDLTALTFDVFLRSVDAEERGDDLCEDEALGARSRCRANQEIARRAITRMDGPGRLDRDRWRQMKFSCYQEVDGDFFETAKCCSRRLADLDIRWDWRY